MTTLSVLIPHYNDPAGLRLTIKSIEAQTWKGSREIVVCDDGSDRQVRRSLDRIAEGSTERIRIVHHAKNRGRPYARNTLLDAAEGKYMSWADAGDAWYPLKIEKQLEGLYRARLHRFTRPVMCTSNYNMHWAGGRPSVRNQEVVGDQISGLLCATLRAYLWTLLGPSQSFRDVGYFDTKLPRLQDLDFFLRFVEKGGMFILPPTTEPLCVYHKSDVGKASEEVLRCYKYIYNKHAAVLLARSWRFRRNRHYDMYMLAARFASNNDDRFRTMGYMARAAFYNPFVFVKRMIENGGSP